MAKVTQTELKTEHADILHSDIKLLTLELTGQEALTLLGILELISGCSNRSARKYADSIHSAMKQSKNLIKEFELEHKALEATGGIAFDKEV